MVQAAQDDAGEVDGLGEVAHQRTLETNHVPPERYRVRDSFKFILVNHRDKETEERIKPGANTQICKNLLYCVS